MKLNYGVVPTMIWAAINFADGSHCGLHACFAFTVLFH